MPALLALLFALFLTAAARADDGILVDTAQHSIAVTTDFAGADLFVFGAVAGDGDVVVAVRGPSQPETVWRREREAGVWVNRGRATVDGVPRLFWISATRPLEGLTDASERERLKLGLDHLQPRITTDDDSTPPSAFWQALVRERLRQGTYAADDGKVQLYAGQLYRARVHLPASLPMGSYSIEAYRIQQGRVTASATTALVVSKAGFNARLAHFAKQQSVAYAVAAILSAVIAGWLAAAAFRRV